DPGQDRVQQPDAGEPRPVQRAPPQRAVQEARPRPVLPGQVRLRELQPVVVPVRLQRARPEPPQLRQPHLRPPGLPHARTTRRSPRHDPMLHPTTDNGPITPATCENTADVTFRAARSVASGKAQAIPGTGDRETPRHAPHAPHHRHRRRLRRTHRRHHRRGGGSRGHRPRGPPHPRRPGPHRRGPLPDQRGPARPVPRRPALDLAAREPPRRTAPPPLAMLRLLRVDAARAPVGTDFLTWATGIAGEEAARAAAHYCAVALFHHDPGSLSAAFVQERLRRATRLPPEARYPVGGWGALIDRMAARAWNLGVRVETLSRVDTLPTDTPVVVATSLES